MCFPERDLTIPLQSEGIEWAPFRASAWVSAFVKEE